MADNHDLLKCPVCDGHGEVQRARLLEFRKPKRKGEVEGCLSEISDPSAEPPEQAQAAAGNSTPRNFQRDVHSWNPQLSMWRRSPKE